MCLVQSSVESPQIWPEIAVSYMNKIYSVDSNIIIIDFVVPLLSGNLIWFNAD